MEERSADERRRDNTRHAKHAARMSAIVSARVAAQFIPLNAMACHRHAPVYVLGPVLLRARSAPCVEGVSECPR